MLTLGSLCTGIGGLERGLRLAGYEFTTEFVADIDPGCSEWLEANEPAPNLGDFTAYDQLPEVDLVVAGFPCQPFSSAGKHGGMTDERYLFDDIARLVGRMGTRPLVFLENVPGLLSANDRQAFARVIHKLAEIGYSLTWGTLPASAVGAPHRRLRWWGIAYPSTANFDDRRPQRARFGAVSLQATLEQPADIDRLARFGEWAAAVYRWETILGRPVPEQLTNGPSLMLDAQLAEWLMGYPKGYVTETLTNRRKAIHALGNAVVPQCAASAYSQLVQRLEAA